MEKNVTISDKIALFAATASAVLALIAIIISIRANRIGAASLAISKASVFLRAPNFSQS